MLAIVQFLILDSREFVNIPRLSKPNWGGLLLEDKPKNKSKKNTAALENKNFSFIKNFGVLREQREFDAVPPVWRDDKDYISAKQAIRMSGKPKNNNISDIGEQGPRKRKENFQFWTYQSPSAKTKYSFMPAFRRLHFDRMALARVDVGFWIFGGSEISGDKINDLIYDLLSLETVVGQVESQALGLQGQSLATLYGKATTPYPSNQSETYNNKIEKFITSASTAVFLDDRMSAEQLPRIPPWLKKMGEHLEMPKLLECPTYSKIITAKKSGLPEIAYLTAYNRLRSSQTSQAVWLFRDTKKEVSREEAKASKYIRQCLLGLHADRHGFIELLKAEATGLIQLDNVNSSKKFFSCMKILAENVLLNSSTGSKRYDLLDNSILLYDIANPNDILALGLAFDKLEFNYSGLPEVHDMLEKIRTIIKNIPESEISSEQKKSFFSFIKNVFNKDITAEEIAKNHDLYLKLFAASVGLALAAAGLPIAVITAAAGYPLLEAAVKLIAQIIAQNYIQDVSKENLRLKSRLI